LGKTVIDILEERGFIEQITDTGMSEAAATQTLKCYVGFDPTAQSLHLGHVISHGAGAFSKRWAHPHRLSRRGTG
jgi:tyrosyl-tRNA synthetase